MPGELNLSVLIASMEPVLDTEEYAFCSVQPSERSKIRSSCTMEFLENEGITLILKKQDAEKEKLDFSYPCRLITLSVHSSLEAVGFLAAITKQLAVAGISVNAVSAFYHDHIFVPTDKAEMALKLLKEMSRAS